MGVEQLLSSLQKALQKCLLVSLIVLVSFPVAVILKKYPDKGNLGKKESILAHINRLRPSLEKLEAASHI